MADWLLYEHDDGRHAVAPSAEAATFAHGDPAWHRVGPVEVPVLGLNRAAGIVQAEIDRAEALLNVEDGGAPVFDRAQTEAGICALRVVLEAIRAADVSGVALPLPPSSIADIQFKLTDAMNALRHAADGADQDVAKVYRARARELAEIVSALAHGVAACRPAADKITIRYERAGRCFWHIGCTAQHHAPPMRIGQDDAEKRRTAIHCTACNEAGYYPHGSVGEVCCERVTNGVQVSFKAEDIGSGWKKQTTVVDGLLAADANDEDPHVMSALNSGVPRADAIQEAIAAGKQARDDGKPRTANPYKRDGERTLWHPWDIGWCRTQAEEDAALGVTVVRHQTKSK